MSYFKIVDFEFLIIFSIIFFFNIVIINYRYQIAKFFKIIDIPSERKIHKVPTPLTGGIGYFLTLLILIFYFANNQINTEKFISLICYMCIFFHWFF